MAQLAPLACTDRDDVLFAEDCAALRLQLECLERAAAVMAVLTGRFLAAGDGGRDTGGRRRFRATLLEVHGTLRRHMDAVDTSIEACACEDHVH